jgi:hypothetical protein
MSRGPEWTDKDDHALRTMVNAGLDAYAMAEKLGRTVHSVW